MPPNKTGKNFFTSIDPGPKIPQPEFEKKEHLPGAITSWMDVPWLNPITEEEKKIKSSKEEGINLQWVEGRVIVKNYRDKKAWHQIDGGPRLRIERDYDNFDQKYTKSTQAIVVSSSYIPEGSEILMHHHATHDVYRIFGYEPLDGEFISEDTLFYSIPEVMCYVYRAPSSEEWLPLKDFALALRVFIPYAGVLQNIPHERMRDTLYITTGELKGQVVRTLTNCDYELIFQGTDDREHRLIRCRHYEDGAEREGHERPEEIIVHDHGSTKLVQEGKLYVGFDLNHCGPIDE